MKRFVLYQEEMGVYLGLGFWSKLDHVGQDSARTFTSSTEAESLMSKWDGGRPAGTRCVEVLVAQDVDGLYYATILDCVRAGLPAWDPRA